MRRLFHILVCLFLLHQPYLTYSQARTTGKRQRAATLTARQIADKVLRSVVVIVTTDEKGRLIGQGSGFVFRPGLVVTNLHVFTRATNAIVKTIANGKSYPAIEVVGMNATRDLCVIRIDDYSIPPLRFATSGRTRIGDEVYVASNPKGLEGSLTKGIVSSIRSDAGLLQIDAAISPGSSGGAVVNQRAEVVGIVKSSLIDGQNLNFAIPAEYVGSLSLDFRSPIVLAGACAYRDRDRDRLKGVVRSVFEKQQTYKFAGNDRSRPERVVRPQTMTVYDPDGNKVEFSAYDVKDGLLAFKQLITHDENRLQTQLIQIWRGGSTEKTTFTFDESVNNKLLNKRFSGILELSSKPELGNQVYDSEGNMMEWEWPTGHRNVYTYEADGREKESLVYNGTVNTIRSRFEYIDDEKGNWIEKREFTYFPSRPEDGWLEGDVTYREITYFR
jgi:S1-C subfamily serine protease